MVDLHYRSEPWQIWFTFSVYICTQNDPNKHEGLRQYSNNAPNPILPEKSLKRAEPIWVLHKHVAVHGHVSLLTSTILVQPKVQPTTWHWVLYYPAWRHLSTLTTIMQALYDFSGSSAPDWATPGGLPQLYVDGFDVEQIWGQIEASTGVLKQLRKRVQKLEPTMQLLDEATEAALDGRKIFSPSAAVAFV